MKTDDPRAVSRHSEYRRAQTPRHLVAAILVCLGIAAVLAFFLPRDDSLDTAPTTVDYQQIGEDAQADSDAALAVPELPDGWYANSAVWSSGGDDGTDEWYLSVMTDTGNQISLRQAVDPAETWIYATMENRDAESQTTIDGTTWEVYGQSPSQTGITYGLATTVDSEGVPTALALYGNGSTAEFSTLAAAAIESLSDASASPSD